MDGNGLQSAWLQEGWARSGLDGDPANPTEGEEPATRFIGILVGGCYMTSVTVATVGTVGTGKPGETEHMRNGQPCTR